MCDNVSRRPSWFAFASPAPLWMPGPLHVRLFMTSETYSRTATLFFFNATPPTEIYTLSLHDALPILWLPAGWEPRSQVITLPATAQAPAIGELKVAEVIVKGPLPRWVSRITTFRAWDGPRLSTRISQIAVVPARSGSSGSQALASLRSARSFTIVDTESVLLDRSGSGSSAETLAVLFKTPAPLA